jgi:hypothetical protein
MGTLQRDSARHTARNTQTQPRTNVQNSLKQHCSHVPVGLLSSCRLACYFGAKAHEPKSFSFPHSSGDGAIAHQRAGDVAVSVGE